MMSGYTMRTIILRGLTISSLCLVACEETTVPKEDTIDPKDFAAPDPCELVLSGDPPCQFGSLKGRDPMEGLGGMGGMGGMGSLDVDDVDDEGDDPEETCLISQEAILRCPSQVGMLSTARGANGELDVAVAQMGTNARNEFAQVIPNEQAYVQTLRLSESGSSSLEAERMDPFVASTGNLALLPASSEFDTLLVMHRQEEEASSGTLTVLPLLGGEAVTNVTTTTPLGPRPEAFVTARGEGVFAEWSPLTGLFISAGLPSSPRFIGLAESMYGMAVDATASGELRAAIHNRSTLRLLGGDALDQELWSFPVDTGVNLPVVDLLHVTGADGELSAVLWRNGDASPFRVTLVGGEDNTISASALFGYESSNCSPFSIGITCDDCPVGQRCTDQSDRIGTARLFEAEGRLFLAYLATYRLEHHEYKRNITSLGLGCTCTTDSVGVEETADFLVVTEIELKIDEAVPPSTTVVMRRPVAEPRQAMQHAWMTRGPGGTLDVGMGPYLGRFSDGQREFPDAPVEYRVLKVEPKFEASQE